MTEIVQGLNDILGHENVFVNEDMAKHTTFRTGGAAELFLTPVDGQMLREAILYLRKHDIRYIIIGNGSNILVRDHGIRGAVIQIHQKMSGIIIDGETVKAQAGALLSNVAARAADASLGGLAFAAGIPGAVGGAITMNAGAYGGEIKDVLTEVEVLTQDLAFRVLSADELALSYRHSIIPEKQYIVVSATFTLCRQPITEIKAEMQDLAQRRRDKQPLQYPSAGSTFKRPEGYFAGKLIEDSGLKGKQIGGAQVSEKHAGFIINREHATSKDILDLIAYCQEQVFDMFGVQMETEVKIIGE